MKGYILAALLLVAPFGAIGNVLNIDPTIPGQTTLTITCVSPVTREDGTPLVIGEAFTAAFFVDKDGTGYLPAGENTTACSQVYDMTKVLDGSYVYAVVYVDALGRESTLSATTVTANVKRLAVPSAPTGVSGALN